MPPATTTHQASAATPHHQASVRPTTVLLMTSLGAVDGTILLLAAQGILSTWSGAIVTGLTVIGGAGAWITARQAFGDRKDVRSNLLLAAYAILGSAAAVGSAALGVWLGANVELAILPKAIGVILLLVAAEVGGIKLPQLAGLPLPFVAVMASVALEGVAQSTLS